MSQSGRSAGCIAGGGGPKLLPVFIRILLGCPAWSGPETPKKNPPEGNSAMRNQGFNRRVFLRASGGLVAGGGIHARLGDQLPVLVASARFSNGRLSGSIAGRIDTRRRQSSRVTSATPSGPRSETAGRRSQRGNRRHRRQLAESLVRIVKKGKLTRTPAGPPRRLSRLLRTSHRAAVEMTLAP